MLNTVKFAMATLRTMREGMRYAADLPVDPRPPETARSSESLNPLEAYFESVQEGPGIWKWRHYFAIYHRYLEKFVGKSPHVLEIGIYSGGSLPMWREYFGEGCQIYGVDIEPACAAHEGEGVRVFIGDQADPAFWKTFVADVPRLDVVIDDGGHEAHQQIPSLRCLLPHMAPGGVYICEDLQGAWQQFHSFVDGLARRLCAVHGNPSPPEPIHQYVASVHRYPALTVIQAPNAPVGPFESVKRGTTWLPGVYDF